MASSSSDDSSSDDNDERKKMLKDASNHEFSDIGQNTIPKEQPKLLKNVQNDYSKTYEAHVASKLCAILDE